MSLSLASLSLVAQPLLAAEKLSTGTLMILGAFGAMVIMSFTYSNWRMGVKLALVAALFEGAIRKWGLPQAQELIYFLKDVILAGAYLRFYFSPDEAVRAMRLKMGTGFVLVAGAVISMSALSPDIGSPILAVFGIKLYLYYLPLVFMMPYLFRSEEDLKKSLLYFALLATPICLLGIAQWALPGSTWLNVYAQGGDNITTMAFSERVRITGTFSYLTGHVTFMVVFFSLHVGLLCTRLPKWAYLWLVANIPLIFANALMSGSRGIIVYMAFFAAAFFSASTLMQVARSRSIAMVMLVVVGLGGFLAVTVFNEAASNWYTRAAEGESVKSRAYDHAVKSMGYAFNEVGIFGYGIGMTHPGMERMRKVLGVPKPRVLPPVYDMEVSQVYVELGLMGFVFWYGVRIMLVVVTFRAFMDSTSEVLKPVLLASLLIQVPHLLFSFVLNHTAGILVSAGAGLALIPQLVSTQVASRGQPAPTMPGSGSAPLPAGAPLRGSLAPPVARGSRVRY